MNEMYLTAMGKIAEFEQRNGTATLYIKGTLYYPNGATRDGESPIGHLAEPGFYGPIERCENIVAYWEEAVSRAREAFDNRKERYLSNAKFALKLKSVPDPEDDPENATFVLTTLRRDVIRTTKMLRDAERALKKARDEDMRPATVIQREKRERWKANREKIAALKTSVEAISI